MSFDPKSLLQHVKVSVDLVGLSGQVVAEVDSLYEEGKQKLDAKLQELVDSTETSFDNEMKKYLMPVLLVQLDELKKEGEAKLKEKAAEGQAKLDEAIAGLWGSVAS